MSEPALLSARRGVAEVAFARQVTMYLAHTHLGLPMTAAGMLVARDRATARHACRKIEDRRDDPRLDELLVCLERGLDVAVRIADFRGRERNHG